MIESPARLVFVTGNPRKISEATRVAKKYSVDFDTQSLDIDEIQHHDPMEVTKAKARAAYQILNQPVVVNDSSWGIPALSGFPGAYAHDMVLWFGTQDWLNLMAEYADRSVTVTDSVVYFDGEIATCFQYVQTGRFSDIPKGIDGNSIEKVAIFAADGRTIAEHHDGGGDEDNSVKLTAWEDFFEWYGGGGDA